MNDLVTHAGDLRPRDCRQGLATGRRHPPRGLTDDLDSMHLGQTEILVSLEGRPLDPSIACSASRAMSSMWPRYSRSSFGIQNLGFRQDAVTNPAVQILSADEVDFSAAEERRQLGFQVNDG